MVMTDSQPTLDQRIRLFIYEHFAEHGSPPVVEQLMTWFDVSRADAVDVLHRLADARHVALVKGTARILMAFPFSAIATPFRVLANGRTYFANCAWDAVMFHELLGAAIAIDSFCQHCAAPIRIEMRDGRATSVQPAEAIVYLARRPADWWADIVTTCSNTMVFFASPEHRDASDLSASADSAASLTPDEALALGKPLYKDRLSMEYVRIGREELMAHFASLGLSGPYWQI